MSTHFSRRKRLESRHNFVNEERKIQMSEEEKDIKADAPVLTPEPELAATPDPEDDESDIDGCDVPIEDVTPDEDLPVTEGGVA